MVRVGGGWDTLEHYLDKHDPCRCTSLSTLTNTHLQLPTKLSIRNYINSERFVVVHHSQPRHLCVIFPFKIALAL